MIRRNMWSWWAVVAGLFYSPPFVGISFFSFLVPTGEANLSLLPTLFFLRKEQGILEEQEIVIDLLLLLSYLLVGTNIIVRIP